MIEGRAVALVFWEERTVFLWFGRPLHYLMESYPDSLMADSHSAVDQLLYHDPLCTDIVLYLIEPAVKLEGMVILERPFRLYAEDPIEIDAFHRAVEVLILLRHNAEAPVMDRQIGSEESVGFFYRLYPLKPHLLHQAVLECIEEAFDPSLGLGRVGKEHPDPELG